MGGNPNSSKRFALLLRLLFLITIATCAGARKVPAPAPVNTSVELESGSRRSGQKLAAVCLGGWLVIEKWIKPSIWNGIPDDDLLDGSQIQLKSLSLGTYVSAEGGGGEQVVVNRQVPSDWETFKIWRHSDGVYSLRVFNNQFISALNAGGGNVAATAYTPRLWETFTLTRNPANNRHVHLRAYNGMYLQAKDPNQLRADFVSSSEPEWGTNSVTFEISWHAYSPLHGEYQLANGWGLEKAPSVFRKHRDTFITAADFQYLSSIGINAVRIPVGYWIASDPNPPKPFVPGSLKALDNAFDWAENNSIKIIIDLHAAPGSQNGQEHSASIDGVSEWATGKDANGNSYVDLTLQVIEFLASRYGGRSGLYGIELLNEPLVTVVNIDVLKSYYKRGYDIVRKYSKDAYVIMCELLGADPSDLLDLGTHFHNAIIDLHYYNAFGPVFANMNIQQNIDYINIQRRQEIERLNQYSNGLLTFVGEWTNELAYEGASQGDYQRLGQAQLQVYGEATAGWAYWNYITEDSSGYPRWNFRRSFQENYLEKPSYGWVS